VTLRLALLLAACCAGPALAQGTPPTAEAQEAAPQGPASVRPDERRAEKPFTVELFGRPVELGLSYETSFERRRNFDLNATSQRDRDVLDHELKLDARLRASESLSLFVQAVGLADRRKFKSDGSVTTTHSWERGQAWLLAERIGGQPLSLQVGRVALIERRSWWWDDDLDALRLLYTPGNWRVETGLAREVARVSSAARGIDPAAKGLTRWFGNASLRWAPRHTVEAFWLLANDRSGAPAPGALFTEGREDEADGRLRWLGLRASGEQRFESKHRWTYRADAALLRGRESRTAFSSTPEGLLSAGSTSSRRVRGHAFDLGTQWVLPGDARPTFSLGLAKGSGGERSATQDRNFRQTGLQENKGRIAGVKRLRYYGALLDPELSNLRIASAGFGLRFLENSSAELLWHRYRQNQASTTLVGSRLSEDPAGLNRDIGREIDLFFAVREWRHVELTLLLSRFRPGTAFAADRRDTAHSIELGAALNF
jgi:alginate production protein